MLVRKVHDDGIYVLLGRW